VRLLIVSGLSGSGKSTVLNVLEDLDFYCIDNLPISLLSNFAAHMVGAGKKFYRNAAVGVDARNRPEELARFPAILAGLREAEINCEVLFLDADDPILIKRFSETRRKHPLTKDPISLPEAIDLERELLDPISQQADLYVDTSHTNLHQLRDMIRQRVATKDQQTLSVLFLSFGYKNGIPVDADLVFDVRCLPNPYWEARLREFTGRDGPVIEYLESHPMVIEMYEDLQHFLERWIPRFRSADRTYLTVAIGCTGGQHRSVYLVERLAAYFSPNNNVLARHREFK